MPPALPDSLPADPVAVAAVTTTAELRRRTSRAPDFENESRALGALARSFAESPQALLQKLADLAMELCQAHSAGVSLLEDLHGESVFRWRALAGKFVPHLGSTLPREFSPCGTVVDHNALQLMDRPVRAFPYIDSLDPQIEEALLVPFHLKEQAVGTIWVISHDASRRFDAEDARLISSLGTFAAAACEVLGAIARLEARLTERDEGASIGEARDRTKDRFLAILAHELRGPLAPIRDATELLRRDTLDSVSRLRTTEIIGRQVQGMSRMIDDLLDVTRLRVGSLPLHARLADLAQIVQLAVETAGPVIKAHNHALTIDMPSEPLLVHADVTRLAQVLHNLLANAAKYTDSGGQIRITARREGEETVVAVSDTGIGIDESDLQSIFELYAQAGQASALRSAGGLGIGLYLARNLVEAHGGTILAFSAGKGCGSEFVVRLRASAPAR